MFADVDFADSAAAASQPMDMFSARELLELGKADVQQMVEQFLAQTPGDTFADVDAQVVVGGVEALCRFRRDEQSWSFDYRFSRRQHPRIPCARPRT